MDQNPNPGDMGTAQERGEYFAELFQEIYERLDRTSAASFHLIRMYFGLESAFSQLRRDPTREQFSDAEMESFLGGEEQIEVMVAEMDVETALLLRNLLAFADAEFSRLYGTTGHPPPNQRLRDNVMDTLTPIDASSMVLTSSESNLSSCRICFETYAASDPVVALPCHPTHHFHRVCIEVRILPFCIALDEIITN
jgi:hypothetical protein